MEQEKSVGLSTIGKLKFLWKFLSSGRVETSLEHYSNINEWLVEQLEDSQSHMIIVCGEFGFGVDNPVVTEALRHAVEHNKRISVFGGPKIMVNEKKENQLFEYLRNCSKKNVSMYYDSNILNSPSFHFIKNGNNVMLEKPHYPSESRSSKLKLAVISNSILWSRRTEIIFERLLQHAKPITSKTELPKLTANEFKEEEKKREFLPIKLKIEKSRHANHIESNVTRN